MPPDKESDFALSTPIPVVWPDLHQSWLEGFASSPEDEMIAKMMYYREGRSQKHLNDCGNILVRSGHLIDMPYVHEWAVKLGLLDIWELICQQARERSTN